MFTVTNIQYNIRLSLQHLIFTRHSHIIRNIQVVDQLSIRNTYFIETYCEARIIYRSTEPRYS